MCCVRTDLKGCGAVEPRDQWLMRRAVPVGAVTVLAAVEELFVIDIVQSDQHVVDDVDLVDPWQRRQLRRIRLVQAEQVAVPLRVIEAE
eukprot:4564728-Prymnesium_polylepis.1